VTLFQIPTLAGQAIAAARRGELKEALHLAQQAWQGARERKDERGILEATNAASIVHMIRGDSISAVAAAIDAHQLAHRLGERSLAGHARVNLCYAGFYHGTQQDAAEVLHRCVDQAVAEKDVGLEIRSRVGLGIVLSELGKYETPATHFDRAMELAESHPHFTPPACIAVNFANHYLRAGELEESAWMADQAFRLALGEEGIPAGIDALGVRALALERLGAGDKALALLAYAVTLGGEALPRGVVLWVLCELARVRFLAAQYEGSRHAWLQALDIATVLRPSAKIHLACAGLADVEAKLGNDEVAAQWRARAKSEEVDFASWRDDTRLQLDRFLRTA
jgi:tetratricopeptide (TPR) repeat protein